MSPRADLMQLVDRARVAFHRLSRGGHAAAERVLRETEAALGRRGELALACVVRTWLAQLLIERGRTADAVRTLEAQSPAPASAAAAWRDAQAWRAWALTDLAHFAEAEAGCLDLAGDATAGDGRWARAVLCRVYLAQRRIEDALALDLVPGLVPGGDASDPVQRALIEAVDIERLLAAGRLFDAGYRVTLVAAEPTTPPGPRAAAMAAVSVLRVRAASGDLAQAEEAYARAMRLTSDAGLPLWSLRARLAWAAALCRVRRGPEARRVLSVAWRRVGAAPPLLRMAVDRVLSGMEADSVALERGEPATSALAAGVSRRFAEVLVAAGQMAPGRRALEAMLKDIAVELGTASLAVVAAEGSVVAAWSQPGALPLRLECRALRDGAVAFDEAGALAVPLRLGPRLVGALVARLRPDVSWAPGREGGLELAAQALAPLAADLTESARLCAQVEAGVPAMVGPSAGMAAVREAIARAARAPFSVLVEGESGAGKELVARAVHSLSTRRAAAFCDVNCAALPDDLVEAELFGHAKGAFTGAVADRPGLFEHATGGTVFLDEVADLSLRAQAKLLRVLQQQEVRRVGEVASRRIDVRVISAANRDMREAAAAGRFRDDLLYRLDVIRIRVPPLRERPEDVAALVAHFWTSAAACVGTSARLTAPVIDALTRYSWPGNVRELQNVLAALAAAAPLRGIVPVSLLPERIATAEAAVALRLDEAREAFERRFVETALARAGGPTRAAAALGLSRQGLAKVMRRLGIPAGTPGARRA